MVSTLQHELAGDLAYQNAILQDVSRTFALTIPQLPGDLEVVVGNAYLLCRIADTIEDSDTLSLEEKHRFCADFASLVQSDTEAKTFAEDLAPRLTGSTLPAERDLVLHTPAVLRITRSFTESDRAALARCVRIMAAGMEEFQEGRYRRGLRDLAHLDAYCYHVAGVVGEMLTELFCSHSPGVARNADALRALAVSFGQGLQMTNILKDIWDDQRRDMCWLPQSVFARHGYDLAQLGGGDPEAFRRGLDELVGVTRSHLENALHYTLLIPKSEQGIRQFCLWALGMAVLSIRKIHRRPDFTAGDQVKIARKSVRATVLAARLFGRSDWMLRALFRLTALGLPRADLACFGGPSSHRGGAS